MGTVSADGNRLKITGVDTCLTNTVLAVICYDISGNRTIFTGRADYLDDIAIVNGARRFAFRQTDSLPDNLPLFINTAAELRRRARN